MPNIKLVTKASEVVRSKAWAIVRNDILRQSKLSEDIVQHFCDSSLRRKRFRAISSRKVGTRAKKGMTGEGEGRRKRLPANPTILKNCVRPRTQLLIGAVLVVLIT